MCHASAWDVMWNNDLASRCASRSEARRGASTARGMYCLCVTQQKLRVAIINFCF
ncbi:MAG TPA: hypothetical protein VH877_06700 [Polyangia bacterium]|nr:hypothetical protein [Polyangia bacterium]